jgi:hypothetical protein
MRHAIWPSTGEPFAIPRTESAKGADAPRNKVRNSRGLAVPVLRVFFRRRFWLRIVPFALITLLIPAYLILLLAPGVGAYHDDGIYLITAQSLAHGTGYRIVSLPSEQLQTKYPILYPAILSVFIRIFPAFPKDLIGLKAISLIFSVLWCFVSHRLLCEIGSRQWSVWIVFFTFAAPMVVFLSSAVLPDTLFAFLSMWAVLLLTRAMQNSGEVAGYALVAGAGVLGGLAFLARTVGIPLILAGTLMLVCRGKYRRAAVFVLACAPGALPWLYWQASHPQPAGPVEAYYSKSNYFDGTIFTHHGLHEMTHAIARNFLTILVCFGESMGGSVAGQLVSIVIWVPIIAGFIGCARSGFTVINLWLMLYLAMILCWIAPSSRYLTPLLPLFLALLFSGVRSVFSSMQLPELPRKCLAAGLIVFAILRMGLSVTQISGETLKKGVALANPAARALDWRELLVMATWIRENTPPDTIVTSELDPIFYLFAQRKAIVPFRENYYDMIYAGAKSQRPIGTVEDLLDHIARNKIGCIALVAANERLEGPWMKKLMYGITLARPEAFRLAQTSADGDYSIYVVDQSRLHWTYQRYPTKLKPPLRR